MYNPAIYHHDGKNETGESDMRAAVALLRKAARGGYASAQLKLGKQLYSAQARQAALLRSSSASSSTEARDFDGAEGALRLSAAQTAYLAAYCAEAQLAARCGSTRP